jgi:ribonuclease BN (tRNA processing enzyme)
MRIHFLGTGGYFPNERRQTACLMLPEVGVILDAGTGIFRARSLVATDQLDVFLSHAHLDHAVGLTYLLGMLHETRVARVVVHGEPAKLDAIGRHLFAELVFPVQPKFVWAPLEPGGAKVPLARDGTLTAFPLEHPGRSVGFRLDWAGHSLAYVTDTTASLTAPYVEFIRGVDVLVHECNFPDGFEADARRTGHSCLTNVAEVARLADVGRVMVVHINPLTTTDPPLDLSSVAHIFAHAAIAHDGQVIEF